MEIKSKLTKIALYSSAMVFCSSILIGISLFNPMIVNEIANILGKTTQETKVLMLNTGAISSVVSIFIGMIIHEKCHTVDSNVIEDPESKWKYKVQ